MTIVFFGTGGTIANRGTSPDDYLNYLDHGTVMGAEELIDETPGLGTRGKIRVAPFAALRSKYVTSWHWQDLSQRIGQVLAEPQVTGVVVGHGTGTLEETAWYLHLTVNSEKPVVLVGAQRPGPTTASDTGLNLRDAFRVAAEPASTGAGVVVVMNRQIHSARDVMKVANHRLDALQSPVRGPLGEIRADHSVLYWRTPVHPHTVASQFAGTTVPLPRVDLVHAYTDADATALQAFLDAGAKGIIAVGYPPGTMPQSLDAAIDEAIADGVQVVQATRAYLEPAVLPRAGLVARRLIINTDISPAKARILLQLCLAHGLGQLDIQRVFSNY